MLLSLEGIEGIYVTHVRQALIVALPSGNASVVSMTLSLSSCKTLYPS